MTDDQKRELNQRYLSAMHGVQTGIGHAMHRDPSEVSPKHLRTGINSALVQSSALANLLVAKGLISEEAWLTALAEGAERERASYEEKLSTETTKVKLV